MIHRICRSIAPRAASVAAGLLLAVPVCAFAGTRGPGVARAADASSAGGDVHGHVVTAQGRGLPGAQVRMMSLSGEHNDERTVVSDTAGAFMFRQMTPGIYEMSVRRIGYKPSFMEIKVTNGGNLDLKISLTAAVQTLDTIAVTAKDEMPQMYGRSLRMAQFYERKQLGIGHFFTREDIEASAATSPADLIRRVGGMHVWDAGGSIIVKSIGCVGSGIPGDGSLTKSTTDTTAAVHDDGWGNVALYVDGSLVGKGFRDTELGMLQPSQIEAMEVYRSPSELPVEASGNACAAVYVWTRIGASN